MNRFAEVIVPFGLRIAWRRASWPTSRSPLSVKATTDGVVRDPSALTITVGSPPSSVAITELVVPRSMPTALAIPAPPTMARRSRRPVSGTTPHSENEPSPPTGCAAGSMAGSRPEQRSVEAHWSRRSNLVLAAVPRFPQGQKGSRYHTGNPLNRGRAQRDGRWRTRSRLGAVPGGQDHLRHRVGADSQLAGDLVGPHPALVVDQRELLLRLRPRWGGAGAGRPPETGSRRAATFTGPLTPTSVAAVPGAPPRRCLAPGQVLAARRLLHVGAGGHLFPGPLVQDLVLVGGLVHPKGEDRQALGISLLAVEVGAIVVLFRTFRM